MNFYKRHIGDYIKDAGHLTLLEHGIYSRLMDVYYTREEALPEDKVARLIGARSKDELQALQNVLAEFFTLEDGHWSQSRCEREIEAANVQAEANRTNGKRGGRPKRIQTEEKPTGNPSGFISDNENNLSQTPDTRLQTPDLKTLNPSAISPSASAGSAKSAGAGSTAGEISKAMRSHGVQSQPADPRILKLVEQGVTVDTVNAACEAAKASKPGERLGVGYIVAILQRWAKEAGDIQANGASAPAKGNGAAPDWEWKKSHAGIDRKGKELGMSPHGGELYPAYADRIQAEIDKRKGRAA